MGDECGARRISDKSFAIPRSESKLMVGQKRGTLDVGERSEIGHKRVKMRDLESVFRSQVGFDYRGNDSWKSKQATDLSDSAAKEISQVTKETITFNSNAPTSGINGKGTPHSAYSPSFMSFDLNATVEVGDNTTNGDTQACLVDTQKLTKGSDGNSEKQRCFDLDLNAEDFSASADHVPIFPNKHYEQLKLRDASDCGSTCDPLEEKDPMEVWKAMKQNGFMSSSHGGVPMPKPRGRKTKGDGLKKKMEVARREQVDRFAKIAAPSGLLSGLNPGIINHVRNSRQVHSIIEALVRSERRETCQAENRQESQPKSGTLESSDRKDQAGCYLNTLSRKENESMVEKAGFVRRLRQSNFNITNEEDILALKLSSSATMASDHNDVTADQASVSSLSIKAANVASQWLELLNQDIKGRLTALKRSKRRVQAVIKTELPFLMCREFSSNQVNEPYVTRFSGTCLSNAAAALHKARWSALFDQMDKALSEEEKQLESWWKQVNEMQLQCDRGLLQCGGEPGMQRPGTSENDCRLVKGDGSDRDLAVRASAAAFYSTCNFLQSMESLPSFC